MSHIKENTAIASIDARLFVNTRLTNPDMVDVIQIVRIHFGESVLVMYGAVNVILIARNPPNNPGFVNDPAHMVLACPSAVPASCMNSSTDCQITQMQSVMVIKFISRDSHWEKSVLNDM